MISDDIVNNYNTSMCFRCPIEVIRNSEYSLDSDIYMLAMVLYEYFMAVGLYDDDPMANHLKCIPFPFVEINKVCKSSPTKFRKLYIVKTWS